MGINGTDVSKEVSDIVLADDSFSTIVVAVKEGRRIYDNIRNVLVYLLTGNAVEILCVFVGMIFGVEIFLPIQLLYINLITDSIPAIALSFEKEDSNIMTRKIRKKDSSFFTPFLISKITISAILKTIAVSLVYFLTINKDGPEAATTMAFLTLILLEVVFAYSCKNLKKSVLNKSFISNKSLNRSIILLIAIQLVVFLSPIRSIFSITNLSLSQIGFCFLLTVISFIIDEV
jgi:Ca2+-transporting ATPase